MDVAAAVPWDKVQNVFVDLSYEDPANGISQQGSVTFSKTDPAPKSFTVELRDPNKRRVAYEITILFNDGRMAQIPRSYTLDNRVFVRSDMHGHKIVSIRPRQGIGRTFSKHSDSNLDLPMVCLVTGSSASASEIVSA